ncbi:family 20 glycosylhydrolase [Olivibacter sp. CPCC 100613]|uniref:family 20 glycosylhydrolase n=1 Tax=Olivibacter sp. CPCC 100613 TaxID=3079931 RepID=UPI002FF75B75
MKISHLFLPAYFVLFLACSNNESITDKSEPLILKWKLLESSSTHNTASESAFTIVNNSDHSLTKGNWKLYFNIGSLHANDLDSSHIKIEQVNGDLFSMAPDSSFKEVDPGDSILVQVVSRKIRNITDFPNGFYVVFNQDSTKGIGLPIALDTPQYIKKQEIALNAKIYDQNSKILAVDGMAIPPIFPTPKNYSLATGSFKLDKEVKIYADSSLLKEANHFIELCNQLNCKAILTNHQQGATVRFERRGYTTPETYELVITPVDIKIYAGDPAGAFYAIQSVKTLMKPDYYKGSQTNITLPCLRIQDQPRFEHRAFQLDVGRNFQPKEQIFKLLDLMALYKLNVFHFHLVEDEGWRLEIPGLPELTEVGAFRGHTVKELDHLLPSYGSGPDKANKAGGGYYSRKDYIEILRYAKSRHIRVIPEIETPGHARAAIKAMNARYQRLKAQGKENEGRQYLLHDLADQSDYRSVQGFNDNVMNVALPSTYTFLEKVSDELINMHKEAEMPLQTIHFGGDEVPAGVWEKSPAVQELMTNNPTIKSVDDLWYYYFDKLQKFLSAKKLYLSAWEEAGLRKVTDKKGNKKMIVEQRFAKSNFHLDVWNNLGGNEDLAYKLANAGYQVILTNVTNMYLDLAYNPSFFEIGQYWGGYVDIEKPFRFIPFNYYKNQVEDEKGNILPANHFVKKEQLTEFGKEHIVGIQAPLWSEKIINKDRLEYLLLPKLLGLAERAWAPDPSWANEVGSKGAEASYLQAWSVFLNTVGKRELPRLDFYNGGFLYRIPTPGLKKIENTVHANIQLPGLTIRYTTDGSEPNMKSNLYSSPISFQSGLKFRAFNSLGRGGRTVSM